MFLNLTEKTLGNNAISAPWDLKVERKSHETILRWDYNDEIHISMKWQKRFIEEYLQKKLKNLAEKWQKLRMIEFWCVYWNLPKKKYSTDIRNMITTKIRYE